MKLAHWVVVAKNRRAARPWRTRVCVAALALLLSAAGCLRREITYTIGADGSAVVHFTASGDRADIEQGDLMPPKGVWDVKEKEVTKPDGKKEYVYEATKSFAKATDIPANYAVATTRFPNAYLQAPVQFQMRDEGNAKVYEFALTYKARKWKEYWDLVSEMVGPDLSELTKRYGVEKLTPDEQCALFTALVRWQLRLYYDRIAVALSHAPAVAAEKKQAILKRVDDAFDRITTKEEMAKTLDLAEEARNKAFDQMKKRGFDEADAILNEELKGAEYAEPLKKMHDEIAEATLDWDITNDLGDDGFSIKIEMPGTVVKSNSEKVEASVATWEFDADKFRDADYVMTVTSKVAK